MTTFVPTVKSYYHRGGETPLLGLTIAEHFANIVCQYPEREAVVSIPQQQSLTYSELSEQVDNVAKGLLGFGYGKEDRIGILSTNNLQWIILQLATARIGAILVNINPAYRLSELKYALKSSAVQCLFIIPGFKTSNYVEILNNLLPELATSTPDQLAAHKTPTLKRIVIFDPDHINNTQRPATGYTLWSELITGGTKITSSQLNGISAKLDRDDPINIQYTSGTTGFPKAVVLTHHNILNNAYFSAKAMHFTIQDRLCVPVPFYHCFGMVLANLLCFSVGATLVIPCEYFSPAAVLAAIEQESCTAVHGVPTMFIAELEHPDFKNFNLESLRTGIMAGAPCPPELMQQVMHAMHCREILIGYGETEASPLTHLTSTTDTIVQRTTTVGRNLPHQEVKIIDLQSDQTVALGTIGEICFRGYHVMQGYYNDVDATTKTIDHQGWLHSGDLGAMDKKGYLTITGRLKDMVIRGGENIYPREIEDYLFTHPKVSEVAVFGIPDDYYGEELVAWIKPHPGEILGTQDILDFCQDNLAHYKIPKIIQFVEEFPMTVTGKPQKQRMREITLALLNGASS
jgi:fatty-acyl-CoA synthase